MPTEDSIFSRECEKYCSKKVNYSNQEAEETEEVAQITEFED